MGGRAGSESLKSTLVSLHPGRMDASVGVDKKQEGRGPCEGSSGPQLLLSL